MTSQQQRVTRWSLSFLWIVTAVVSVTLGRDIGFDVLARINLHADAAALTILAGSLLDLIIGLWLLSGRALRACCLLQLAVIVNYSILLTLIAPAFWLHPFGPLTKNVPILVLIGLLYSSQQQPTRATDGT